MPKGKGGLSRTVIGNPFEGKAAFHQVPVNRFGGRSFAKKGKTKKVGS